MSTCVDVCEQGKDSEIAALKHRIYANESEIQRLEGKVDELHTENMILTCENQMLREDNADHRWFEKEIRFKMTPATMHRKRMIQSLKRVQESTGMEWKAVWGMVYKILERLGPFSWRKIPKSKKKIDVIWANEYLRAIFIILVYTAEQLNHTMERAMKNNFIDKLHEKDPDMADMARQLLIEKGISGWQRKQGRR